MKLKNEVQKKHGMKEKNITNMAHTNQNISTIPLETVKSGGVKKKTPLIIDYKKTHLKFEDTCREKKKNRKSCLFGNL